MTTLKEFLERMEKERKRNNPTPRKTHPSLIITDPISLSLEAFYMAQVHGNWDLVAGRLREQRLRLDGGRTTTNPRLD